MGLMSDLKEFGQNFVLAAGDTIAENIKKRDEQYRKDVLDQYSTLKANIKKNKAADQKLFNSMLDEAKTLVGLAPNLPEAYLSYGLSSKDNYKQLLKALQEDSERGKSGFFISEWAAKNNMEPSDIYKPRQRDVSSMVRSLRSPTIKTTKPKSKISPDTEDTLKSLAGLVFGGSTGPDKVIEAAEAKISGKGRGVFGKSDLDYAYTTPTRGISLPDKTVSLKRVMKSRDIELQLFPKISETYKTFAQNINYKIPKAGDAGEGVTIDQNIEAKNKAARDLYGESTGLNEKLDAVFRAYAGSGDMKFTKNVIKKQFPIPNNMPEEEKQQTIKFVEYLIITLPRIYSQELTSYSKMLQEMGKVILNRGQNPQGSSLLNPPPEQN
tara:strand:+ start:2317 stop:3459 length:1143 start_codon:yes stop_codon:yes gene_type:complete